MHECGDCGKTYEKQDDLPKTVWQIDSILERLDPGDTVPSGECSCGGLTFQNTEEPSPIPKIKHRDKLLGCLADELTERDKHNEAMKLRGSHLPQRTTDVTYINVRLLDEDQEVLFASDFTTTLRYLVEDIYWSEEGDWSTATRVEFD